MSPEVGDIWNWNNEWTVLLLKELRPHVFLGISLEDGWRGEWEFFKYHMERWEKLV